MHVWSAHVLGAGCDWSPLAWWGQSSQQSVGFCEGILRGFTAWAEQACAVARCTGGQLAQQSVGTGLAGPLEVQEVPFLGCRKYFVRQGWGGIFRGQGRCRVHNTRQGAGLLGAGAGMGAVLPASVLSMMPATLAHCKPHPHPSGIPTPPCLPRPASTHRSFIVNAKYLDDICNNFRAPYKCMLTRTTAGSHAKL